MDHMRAAATHTHGRANDNDIEEGVTARVNSLGRHGRFAPPHAPPRRSAAYTRARKAAAAAAAGALCPRR